MTGTARQALQGMVSHLSSESNELLRCQDRRIERAHNPVAVRPMVDAHGVGACHVFEPDSIDVEFRKPIEIRSEISAHHLPRWLLPNPDEQFCTPADLSNPQSRIVREFLFRATASVELRNSPAIPQQKHSPINERGGRQNKNNVADHGELS